MIPKIVHGQFVTSAIAPKANVNLPVIHQATMPKRKPMIASGACIANPRL